MKKNYIVLITLILINSLCQAQLVLTKDGVSLGSRKEFILSCTKGADKKLVNLNGLQIETYKYCTCICDNLIPTINSADIQKAMKNNKLIELFTNDNNLQILIDCAEGKVTMAENFKYGESGDMELQKKVGIKNCVNTVLSKNENSTVWTQDLAQQYCDCAINKLLKNGYTYSDLKKIEDENSPSYNEIGIPCLNDVLKTSTNFKSTNSYSQSDIVGTNYRTSTPLVDYFGNSYKIKITIAGVSKYYLFDTGATDLIIDKATADEILRNGEIKNFNILFETEYTLANKTTVKGEKAIVDNIIVGDYKINNVVIGIVESGNLLCGKSFLDKFSKWEIDQKNKTLLLYK